MEPFFMVDEKDTHKAIDELQGVQIFRELKRPLACIELADVTEAEDNGSNTLLSTKTSPIEKEVVEALSVIKIIADKEMVSKGVIIDDITYITLVPCLYEAKRLKEPNASMFHALINGQFKVGNSKGEMPINVVELVEKPKRTAVRYASEFERVPFSLLERINLPCSRALEESRLRLDKICAVEFVRSSSRIHAIMMVLSRTLNASECIAQGCALQHTFPNLRDEVDDFSQYGMLTKLCEILSISLEELECLEASDIGKYLETYQT
ncbi:hypothetical protein SUGI_0667180 [Cryptomeria japonica]|nr:hypothetical protein SUGI_0667180 [Cryptomeria japonica]